MLCRSNYVNSLDASNLQIYESKIQYCSGIDPYEIAFETCETDWNLFPNIQYGDIVNYLVFSTSSATLEEMKAFKSMEAHNFFTSGFVKQEIYLKTVDPEKVLLLGQVNHSQSLRAKPLQVWILSKLGGEVVSANCTCMAGLGGACSHVGALLFAIDMGIRLRNDTSCTSQANAWLPAHIKNVPLTRVRDLDFSSANKKQKKLQENSLFLNAYPAVAVSKEKSISDESIQKFFSDIAATGTDSAILRIASPFCEKFKTLSVPDTYEKFYRPEYEKLSWDDLFVICKNIFDSKIIISEQEIALLEKMTRKQAKDKLWFTHRAGRITASNMKAVCSTKLYEPSISLLKKICYPLENSFTTAATTWGIKNENKALEQYLRKMKNTHSNFIMKKNGLLINKDFPFIAATPDSIVSCNCCGKGICEIKCPYILRDCDPNQVESFDHPFLIVDDLSNVNLSTVHKHYYQVQTQMFVLGADYGDFVVWTKKGLYTERILPDILFWEEVLEKAQSFYLYAVLPELAGKWFTKNE